MEATDLRTEFAKETKRRFNTEWLAYNDYVDWLEQKLVKLLTIPHVVGRSEQLSCETCIFNTHSWSEDYPCATCCGFDKHQAT